MGRAGCILPGQIVILRSQLIRVRRVRRLSRLSRLAWHETVILGSGSKPTGLQKILEGRTSFISYLPGYEGFTPQSYSCRDDCRDNCSDCNIQDPQTYQCLMLKLATSSQAYSDGDWHDTEGSLTLLASILWCEHCKRDGLSSSVK